MPTKNRTSRIKKNPDIKQDHEVSQTDNNNGKKETLPYQEFFQRGIYNLSLRKIPEAIEDFTQAINLNPEFADAYLNRGLAFEREGRIPENFEDYKRSLEIDPEISSRYLLQRTFLNSLLEPDTFNRLKKFEPISFSLDSEHMRKLNEWYNSLDKTYAGAIGGELSITFTFTSIGIATSAKYIRLPIYHRLGLKDETIDLTNEYEFG